MPIRKGYKLYKSKEPVIEVVSVSGMWLKYKFINGLGAYEISVRSFLRIAEINGYTIVAPCIFMKEND